MAERSRGFLDRFIRRRADPADVEKLNQVLNRTDMDWDGKDLASLSKIQTATNRYAKTSGATTPVDYGLLRTIANKSEVVNAILRRAVDDTLSNGYRFKLAEGKESGDTAQLEKAREFFKRPNPDDMGDEWLETMLFDLILFGDAYLELDGSEDYVGENEEDWNFGGQLVGIWPIEADTMKILPNRQLPQPPEMAYVQNINQKTRRFSRDKVLHIAKFKQGRGYGSSPLIPLLEVITGQLNLSNYLNALYTGTLPKTILNVGDISNAEMKAMLGLIEQQLAGGQSPFGLIAINGGSGFNMHRLIDSTREGAQLDLLYYYREEICAVFGIPPMKLGWVQTGKLANPEQQLDSWYDVVESYHQRVATVINNNILPLLEITDWDFEFISIRPKQDAARAETFNNNSNAISTLRQEATISINEARSILGLERIESEEADDPFFVSPSLQINQPDAFEDSPSADDETEEEDDENLDEDSEELTLLDLFPPIGIPEDAGKGAGDSPWFEEVEVELSDEDRLIVMNKRTTDADEFLEIEETRSEQMIELFAEAQQGFASRLMEAYDGRFRNNEVIASKDLAATDISWAISTLDDGLEQLMDSNLAVAGVETMGAYQQTLGIMNAGTATTIAFTTADAAVLSFWQRRWVLPALRNTLNGFRSRIVGVFETMATTGRSWKWASAEMRRLIDPSGDKYPKGYYERIARTEVRRCVETAHISGLNKSGIRYTQRLVEIDTQTDKDLCLPYSDAKYRIKDASGVLPAHPNCRCTMVGFIPEEDFEVIQNPIKPDIPQPTKSVKGPDDDWDPPCRKEGELYDECVSRKIGSIMAEDPTISSEQAVAMASSMCEKMCEGDD